MYKCVRIASHRVAAHRVTSHHMTSHHIESCGITSSGNIASHRVTSHHLTSHRIVWHRIVWGVASHHLTLHRIVWHRIASCSITSPDIASHRVASHRIVWHHIHHIASHGVASHRIAWCGITSHHMTSNVIACQLSPPRGGNRVSFNFKTCELISANQSYYRNPESIRADLGPFGPSIRPHPIVCRNRMYEHDEFIYIVQKPWIWYRRPECNEIRRWMSDKSTSCGVVGQIKLGGVPT